jgi:hypothetical protein
MTTDQNNNNYQKDLEDLKGEIDILNKEVDETVFSYSLDMAQLENKMNDSINKTLFEIKEAEKIEEEAKKDFQELFEAEENI